MIRVVFDTNIIISGTLWSGTPHLVMQTALQGNVKPVVSEVLLDELKDVLERPKFVERLRLIGKTASQVVEDFAALAEVIEVGFVEQTISADADDDHVPACAFTGHAAYIVSGDPHLLEVHQYKDIPILTANEFLARLANENDENQTDDE